MVAPAAILAAAAAALWTPLRSFMPRTRHPSMAAPLVRQPSMTAATASPDTSTAPRHFSEEEWSWSKQWYPMAFCKVTDKASPHRLELLGEELVLWYDGPAQAWRTMRDACPHRRAPLSEGRIDADGQIECPYHGWTFQGVNGACTKIPQAEGGGDAPMLARCGGSAHPTVEKQGIVWVWGEPLSPGAPQPLTSLVPTCEAMDDDRFVWIDVSRDMPYSADMLLENVLDSSHVPFTHDSTISKRQNAIPLKLKLASPIAPAGFRGQQAAPPVFTGRATERTTSFRAPAYMHHRIRSSGGLEPGAPPTEEDFKAGFETWTVAYATPTGPGRCRLMARFPFRFPEPVPKPGLLGRLTPRLNAPKLAFKLLPDWVNHMGQLKVRQGTGSGGARSAIGCG
jgi:phenylpropionate dioxygenase-like ring-hydroxylating dioxygenase large terminal subunit